MKKDSWFEYLKRGWARQLPQDKIAASQGGYGDVWVNLKVHVLPFVKRHWRMGLVGAVLILFNSALAFPGPLINRFLIDQVILGKQPNLLVVYVLLMAGVYLVGMFISTVQSWYLTRFDQAVVFDLETDLLDHTLHLPKSFFDETEVGYLMSRLSDVTGLRWFFSGTMVSILTNFFQMIGGIVMLFYLEWHLATPRPDRLTWAGLVGAFLLKAYTGFKPPGHGALGECVQTDAGVALFHFADQGLCS